VNELLDLAEAGVVLVVGFSLMAPGSDGKSALAHFVGAIQSAGGRTLAAPIAAAALLPAPTQPTPTQPPRSTAPTPRTIGGKTFYVDPVYGRSGSYAWSGYQMHDDGMCWLDTLWPDGVWTIYGPYVVSTCQTPNPDRQAGAG
jgi:hypothetical protein